VSAEKHIFLCSEWRSGELTAAAATTTTNPCARNLMIIL
jgi:hypothetical protein